MRGTFEDEQRGAGPRQTARHGRETTVLAANGRKGFSSMNLLSAVFVLVIAVGILAVPPPAAAQQETPALKIAVIDVARIFREAKAVQSIQNQLRPHVEKFRDTATTEEQALRTAHQELQRRQATILTPEAYAQERRNLEQRTLEVQQKMGTRKRAIDQSRATAMQAVENSLNEIIAALFDEQKYTLILRRGQTAFFDPRLDITEEVLKRLNQKLPTVQVTVPSQ